MGIPTDPIAEMLTRVRNAIQGGHDTLLVPTSKMKVELARILKEEGFIRDFEVVKATPRPVIRLRLKYMGKKEPAIKGLRMISKPGRRVYTPTNQVPRVYGGLGVSILSTPQGIMTGQEARKRHLGGEVICYVW